MFCCRHSAFAADRVFFRTNIDLYTKLTRKEALAMLDIKFIRENPEAVKKGAEKKHIPCDVDKILELDKQKRALLQETEQLRASRKQIAKQAKDKDEARAKGIELKEKLAELEEQLRDVDATLRHLLLLVPNIPLDEVPEGKTDEDNVHVRSWGEPVKFNFEPKDHVELVANLGLVDFERGAKVSGARFYYLTGTGALLEMAVLRYALDTLMKSGFTPMITPVFVREPAMEGTGFLPRGADEAYQVPEDKLYLTGTSEVALVSYHMNDVLDTGKMPYKYAGISNCFRREAGAAGKDTRGLYRLHQFQKIEQVVLCRNDEEESRRCHEMLLSNSESILQGLKLPYRVMRACGGECGIPQVLKHEIETWMPSRGKYSETHSCSSIYDFQARRLNIKYRDENNKLTLAYTLNNTAIASPRILIPILEHYQQADGSVVVPEVLRPYMNGMEIIEPVK